MEINHICKMKKILRRKMHWKAASLFARTGTLRVSCLVVQGHGVPDLVNLSEPNEGQASLHLAALSNDEDVIKLLLNCGAYPNVRERMRKLRGKRGSRPLRYLYIWHSARLRSIWVPPTLVAFFFKFWKYFIVILLSDNTRYFSR